MKRLALVALSAALLAGCSQVAAIAPVGGNHLSEVRYAAIDLLVENEIDVLTAPVCATAADKTLACEGETVDGETITVTSPGDEQNQFTLVVGTETLYSGSVQDVLDDAMRPSS